MFFGGCGGYVTYYMGIANSYKVVILSDVKFIGSSAGIVPAFLLAIEYDIEKAYVDWFLPWMKKAKKSNLFLKITSYQENFSNQ